jgi:hypothetical protein
VHAPFAAGILQRTSRTGHPTIVATFVGAAGPRRDGSPRSVCFTGQLDGDELLLDELAADLHELVVQRGVAQPKPGLDAGAMDVRDRGYGFGCDQRVPRRAIPALRRLFGAAPRGAAEISKQVRDWRCE